MVSSFGGQRRSGLRRAVITVLPGGGAESEYPNLGCTGRLEPAGTSGTAGRTATYRETMTSGNCVDGAAVTLDRTERDRMRLGYTVAGTVIEGNLTRRAPAP